MGAVIEPAQLHWCTTGLLQMSTAAQPPPLLPSRSTADLSGWVPRSPVHSHHCCFAGLVWLHFIQRELGRAGKSTQMKARGGHTSGRGEKDDERHLCALAHPEAADRGKQGRRTVSTGAQNSWPKGANWQRRLCAGACVSRKESWRCRGAVAKMSSATASLARQGGTGSLENGKGRCRRWGAGRRDPRQ